MRHQSRETAFKIIYQIDIGKNDMETALQHTMNNDGLNDREQVFCRELVTAVEEKLADMDYYKIRLGVIKENINGKLFWESMGFKKINEYSTYIVMEKQIKIEPEKF